MEAREALWGRLLNCSWCQPDVHSLTQPSCLCCGSVVGMRGWRWGGRHAHYNDASVSSEGWQHTASRGYDPNRREWFWLTVNILGRTEGRRRWLWVRAVWHRVAVGNPGGGELMGQQGDRQAASGSRLTVPAICKSIPFSHCKEYPGCQAWCQGREAEVNQYTIPNRPSPIPFHSGNHWFVL